MKNNNLTLLDQHQIAVQQHDPDNDAQRVIIVGGDGQQIANAIRESLKDIKIDIPKIELPSVQPTVITTPQMDIEYVQVPVIVKETEFMTIEKPIIVTEVKIVEIEKPVIIKEKELAFSRIEIPVIVKELYFPKWIYFVLGFQLLINIIGLFAHNR